MAKTLKQLLEFDIGTLTNPDLHHAAYHALAGGLASAALHAIGHRAFHHGKNLGSHIIKKIRAKKSAQDSHKHMMKVAGHGRPKGHSILATASHYREED